MKTSCPALLIVFLTSLSSLAQPDPRWLGHDRTRPLPPVVQPGAPGSQGAASQAPSDAHVLFDGSDLSAWARKDGTPAEWLIRDGALECVPKAGHIRTRRSFGDCQLHVEWMTPESEDGTGQGFGNSGVFFGGYRYEVQVLGSHGNTTYADGSAGSVYNQYPPEVNASLPPGQWQTYDIIYTAPRFDPQGGLISKAYLTVFHNGVLVQNHVELTGPTEWLNRPPYTAHPVKQPIYLQEHGNPVRFRNVWIRELGEPGKPEYYLPDKLLDSYVGDYWRNDGKVARILRGPDGQLILTLEEVEIELFAQAPDHFFAKTTDVQCTFAEVDGLRVALISVGAGDMTYTRVN